MNGRVEVARRRQVIGAVLLLALVITAVFGTAGAAGAKSPFKPGLYVGKTSQGEPVRLRLTVGGAACEGSPCLFAPSSASDINVLLLSCTVKEASINEYLALGGDKIPANGTLHVKAVGFSTLNSTIKVSHHGTLTGTVRGTSTLEGGIRCNSGPVTLSAKIGGTTR